MKVKQILAVILVVAFAMLAIPVSAAEPADTAISERRVELCGNCGGRMVTSTTWESWYTVAQIKGTHHNYGTDLRQQRDGTATTKCQGCGQGYTTSKSQTRIVCHGYDS